MTNSLLIMIDIGNSNMDFAIYDADKIIFRYKISTKPVKTADEIAAISKNLLSDSNIKPADINKVYICNVGLNSLNNVQDFTIKYLGQEAIIVKATEIGLDIKIDNKQQLGADRAIASLAASYKYPQNNILIIDFGTAVTFDIVTMDKEYLGGMIYPGIELSLNSLHKYTSALPFVDFHIPEKIIGKNTIEAINSGFFYGYIGMIEGIIAKIKQEITLDKIITTGGMGEIFQKYSKDIESYEENLILDGLYYIDKYQIL